VIHLSLPSWLRLSQKLAQSRRACAEWSREVSRLEADLEFAYEMNARLMTQLVQQETENKER
jgi:hypothetical protein